MNKHVLFQILFREFDREKGKHPLKDCEKMRSRSTKQIVIITLLLYLI